jgi:hypothetical protein
MGAWGRTTTSSTRSVQSTPHQAHAQTSNLTTALSRQPSPHRARAIATHTHETACRQGRCRRATQRQAQLPPRQQRRRRTRCEGAGLPPPLPPPPLRAVRGRATRLRRQLRCAAVRPRRGTQRRAWRARRRARRAAPAMICVALRHRVPAAEFQADQALGLDPTLAADADLQITHTSVRVRA